jgi:hypothetical protein
VIVVSMESDPVPLLDAILALLSLGLVVKSFEDLILQEMKI